MIGLVTHLGFSYFSQPYALYLLRQWVERNEAGELTVSVRAILYGLLMLVVAVGLIAYLARHSDDDPEGLEGFLQHGDDPEGASDKWTH